MPFSCVPQDDTGRKILGDTGKLMADTKEFWLEKNEGEKLQRLVKEGHKATGTIAKESQRLKGFVCQFGNMLGVNIVTDPDCQICVCAHRFARGNS